MPIDLPQLNVTEGDEPIQHDQRGVLGAERGLRLRAATEFPDSGSRRCSSCGATSTSPWEVVEREELKPGFLQGLRDRRTQGGPLLHEGVIGRAGGQAIGGVEQTMVITFHLACVPTPG